MTHAEQNGRAYSPRLAACSAALACAGAAFYRSRLPQGDGPRDFSMRVLCASVGTETHTQDKET